MVRIAFLFAPLLALCAREVSAQSDGVSLDTIRLTLSDARTRGVRANPDLVAARLDTAVALGELRQARIIRFNPSADVLAKPTGEELEAGLSQEIEVFGQRGARISAAKAGAERANASVADVTRLIVGQVDRTFYRLAAVTQRAKLSDEVLALNERLADVAGRQQREGEISRLDYNLVLVELGRARARSLAARREREGLTIELGRLVGLPRGTPMSVVDSFPTLKDSVHSDNAGRKPSTDAFATLDLDSLTAHALRRRPDLRERAAAVRQSNTLVSLSRREALPNPVLRGVFEQPTRGGPSTIRPGIGLSLPFLNRSQGEREALRAAARRAELEQAALVAVVRAEVATALTAYRSATAEAQVLETTVIASARQNRALGEIAYREGKVGLPVLLLIQNQAIDAELEYWSAWQEAREALANLAEATAQNIEGLLRNDSGAGR